MVSGHEEINYQKSQQSEKKTSWQGSISLPGKSGNEVLYGP